MQRFIIKEVTSVSPKKPVSSTKRLRQFRAGGITASISHAQCLNWRQSLSKADNGVFSRAATYSVSVARTDSSGVTVSFDHD